MARYDLSHPLETGTPVYPGDPPVAVEPVATVADDGYRVARLALSTHAGTHVDAPAHVIAGGATIDDLPVDRFRWSARLVDLAGLEAGAAIDADALAGAVGNGPGGTDAVGNDPGGTDAEPGSDADLLAVRTGWDRHWGTGRYLEHPHLTAGAAEWLVARDLELALDAPSPDPSGTEGGGGDEAGGEAGDGEAGDDEPYPVHRRLCGDGRLIVENLRGLGRLPDWFELHAHPLRIVGGDGSPVRAVAVVDDGDHAVDDGEEAVDGD